MNLLQFFLFSFSLFVICSPFAAIPAMITLTKQRSSRDRKRIGKISALSVFIILFFTVWVGEPVLQACGVRISSFQVAGGIVIFILSLSMMKPQVEQSKEEFRDSIAVVPLAIPLMAGPGAMSQIIVATCDFPGFFNHLVIAASVILVSALLWLCLYFAVFLEKILGSSGLNIISRLGGLVLASIAVETIAKGVMGFLK